MMTTTEVAPRPARSDDDETRWAAVIARDPRADGTFVYSVRTTGVYCRPSCASRRARRENVAFHARPEDAEREGFRACKRCDPRGPALAERHAETIARACRSIADSAVPVPLATLARAAGMSPFHFHRVFKATAGVTPKAYARAVRADRVREALARGEPVARAMADAGFTSNGRFYESTDAILGMTPRDYRGGAPSREIRFAIGACSLGAILVAASERGVCAILLGDDPDALARDLQDRFPRAQLAPGDRTFDAWVAQVVGLVEAPAIGLELPLDVRGTAFQERVWQALREIPCGTTATYADVAARIGARSSVRAVAQACAANPLAVAIPCHRVVRRDGDLAGYRWGVDRKRALLERERPRRST